MRTATSASEDYLKAIYFESASGPESSGRASTTGVARRLGVSGPSATNMIKKLAAIGLLSHSRYRGVRLTRAGRAAALEVIRHHRLVETYLVEALGVPWDAVHAEAEVLEHVLSEDLEERIAQQLGDPTRDPHGHPIPTKDLKLFDRAGRSLWSSGDGDHVTVERVSDEEPEVLRFLGSAGIRPGTRVTIVRRGPLDGPLFISIDRSSSEIALSREVAENIWVA